MQSSSSQDPPKNKLDYSSIYHVYIRTRSMFLVLFLAFVTTFEAFFVTRYCSLVPWYQLNIGFCSSLFITWDCCYCSPVSDTNCLLLDGSPKRGSTLLVLQSRFGDEPVKLQVICPQLFPKRDCSPKRVERTHSSRRHYVGRGISRYLLRGAIVNRTKCC